MVRTRLGAFCDRLIEVGWLAALVIVGGGALVVAAVSYPLHHLMPAWARRSVDIPRFIASGSWAALIAWGAAGLAAALLAVRWSRGRTIAAASSAVKSMRSGWMLWEPCSGPQTASPSVRLQPSYRLQRQ